MHTIRQDERSCINFHVLQVVCSLFCQAYKSGKRVFVLKVHQRITQYIFKWPLTGIGTAVGVQRQELVRTIGRQEHMARGAFRLLLVFRPNLKNIIISGYHVVINTQIHDAIGEFFFQVSR